MERPCMTEYIAQHLVQHPTQHETSKIILIATAQVTGKTLFNNGLYQNIILLYKLLEGIGHQPYLLLDKLPEIRDILTEESYRLILPEEIMHKIIIPHIYIEVGMSVAQIFSDWLKTKGTKIVKYFLGNTLNIDIENSPLQNKIYFTHHSLTYPDEIWTSPHYAQHLEYMCSIYQVPFTSGHIAPYLWDPRFIENIITTPNQQLHYETTDIVIAEPNFSFQKSALYPLILADTYAKEHPEWKGRVKVMNAGPLTINGHFQTQILPTLYLQERIDFIVPRKTIKELIDENPTAVFIGYQWNNEYNYMTLELMWKGVAILHNTSAWSSTGYYWTESNLAGAIKTLDVAFKRHNRDTYMANARELAQKFSIDNPTVRARWTALL